MASRFLVKLELKFSIAWAKKMGKKDQDNLKSMAQQSGSME